MERQIGKVQTTDENGNGVEVICFQDFIEATGMGDPAKSWLAGHKWYELRDRQPVNLLDDNTFEIVSSGMKLVKVNG